jgi:uncharacterized protein with LGFP repeats
MRSPWPHYCEVLTCVDYSIRWWIWAIRVVWVPCGGRWEGERGTIGGMFRDSAPLPPDDEHPDVPSGVSMGPTTNNVSGTVDTSVQAQHICSIEQNWNIQSPITRKTLWRLVGAVVVGALVVGASFVATPLVFGEEFCDRPYPVKGVILTKYQELAGPKSGLGCPTGEQTDTPDGRGQRMRFTNDGEGNERWIYWGPDTGAHPIWGDIGEKWRSFGRERLGFPITDEETRQPGADKYQTFEHGTIYWRPLPPKSVYVVLDDEIGAKWDASSRSAGLPVADEVRTADGDGKRQEFQGGTIFWHPSSTGARVVLGAQGGFSTTWRTLGRETGPLGAPTADEKITSDDGGRSQEFDHGVLYWHPSRAKTPHPIWHDAIGEQWTKAGGEDGRYGFPVGGEVSDGSGCLQAFEWDVIHSDHGCTTT